MRQRRREPQFQRWQRPGSWLGTGTWTEGGKTAKFTETFSAKMVFGGRFLQMESTMNSDAAPPNPAMTMSSIGFVGYDNAKQKYVNSMVGDWSTSIGTSEGSYDAATKTFTMTGVHSMGGQERPFKTRFRVDSNDQWTFEMFMTVDGKETKAGEAVYKRK